MSRSISRFQTLLNLARAIPMLGLLALTGCASFYVDTATKEIPADAYKKPASPHPVQVVFEFQTKGVANARATQYLAPLVMEQIKGSGLFSELKTTPVEGGALLSVVLNNVPLTDDAFSKGFVTGMTFGLAGSQVSDGYVCTMKYIARPQAPAISSTARHAIHTVMGAKDGPANGTKMDSLDMAVKTMTRQVVSTALDELSRDPEFK
ncbi:MAG: hypothetical protein HY018_09460 [Hydrogenophilales bacterium]|nr:hypothetical protein [Hydrogenophilales bacterium]